MSDLTNTILQRAPMENNTVILRRTFNLSMPDNLVKELDPLSGGSYVRYWRVISPTTHRNYQSDLSIEGLKEWKII